MDCTPETIEHSEGEDMSSRRRSDCETSSGETLGFTPLPRDPHDPRFILAFPTTSEKYLSDAASFFETFGFVVFSDVYSPKECAATRSSMWDIIEKGSPGFQRDNRDTWATYSAAGKYGLSMRGPCFHPNLVDNRQHPNLVRALETIIGTEDVMVSHDRFTIYRATKDDASFSTGDRNVHLDINPWWWCESAPDITEGVSTIQYKDSQDFIKENNLVVKCMGRHVQCVLNFEDNEAADGGTILVPKFHKHINQWCEADNKKVLREKNLQHENKKKEKQQKNILKKQHKDQRNKEKEQHFSSPSKEANDSERQDYDTTAASSVSVHVTRDEDDVHLTTTVTAHVNSPLPHSKTIEHNTQLAEKSVSIPTPSDTIVTINKERQKEPKHHTNKETTSAPYAVKKDSAKQGKGQQKKQQQQQQARQLKPDPVFSESGKWGSTVALRQPLPWVIMSEDSALLPLAQRIPMRAGSVLMWDQTMAHGTQPNAGSSRCRMAMFLKAFDRKKSFHGVDGEARRVRRRAALKAFLAEGVRESLITTAPATTDEDATADITIARRKQQHDALSEAGDIELPVGITEIGRRVFDV